MHKQLNVIVINIEGFTHIKFDTCTALYMCLVHLLAQSLTVKVQQARPLLHILHHRSCLTPAVGRQRSTELQRSRLARHGLHFLAAREEKIRGQITGSSPGQINTH